MKKITIKAYAKVNLTLDVVGVNGGYHDINTFVTTIDLFDKITIKKRKDSAISLKCTGVEMDCSITDNNAYKTAKAFADKFSTNGVDITVQKNIPLGAGLGGSSADIAGVLNGLKTLYGVKDSVLPIANELGSDSGYMLSGGYAVLSGRGDKIKRKVFDKTLYFVILTESEQVSARASYKQFDKLAKAYKPCTAIAEKALADGKFEKFAKTIKNDLTEGSIQIVKQIEFNLSALKKAGARAVVMAGSGSATVAIFDNQKQRDEVYKKLKPLYNNKILKAKTVKCGIIG